MQFFRFFFVAIVASISSYVLAAPVQNHLAVRVEGNFPAHRYSLICFKPVMMTGLQ